MFEIKYDENGKRVACWTETAQTEIAEWNEWDIFAKVDYLRDKMPISFRTGVFSGRWSSQPELRLTNAWHAIATKCLSPTSWQVGVDDAGTIAKIVDCFAGVPDCLFREMKDAIFEQKLNGITGMLLFKDLGVDEMLERWKRLLRWVVKYYPEFPDGYSWDKAMPDHAIAWAARLILGGIKPSDLARKLWKEKRNLIKLTENGLMLLSDEAQKKYTVEYTFKKHPDISAGDVAVMDCFGMGTEISLVVDEAFRAIGKNDDLPEKVRKTVYIGVIPEQWMVDAGVVVGMISMKEAKKR